MLAKIPDIAFVYFDSQDVVRHKLVQNIVSAYKLYGETSQPRPADAGARARGAPRVEAGERPRPPSERRRTYAMNRFRFRLRERLADFREWIDERSPWRFELVLLACLLVGITVIVWTAFLPALHGFTVGKPAPRTMVANQTVTVLDADATAKLKEQVAQLVEPVYYADEQALPKATADLESFFKQVDALRATVTGSSASADVIDALNKVAPDIVSDPTLEVPAHGRRRHLRSAAAPGSGRSQDGVRRPHHPRHAHRRAPDLKSITGALARVGRDGERGLRGGRRLRPAQPSARPGPDPRPAEGGHGPRGPGHGHGPRRRHGGPEGADPHRSSISSCSGRWGSPGPARAGRCGWASS